MSYLQCYRIVISLCVVRVIYELHILSTNELYLVTSRYVEGNEELGIEGNEDTKRLYFICR